MGNSASGDKGRYRHGYHVLMVKEDTPAARAGLRPYFDYIMGINGIRLNKEDSTLRDQMEASEDRAVVLDIYSTREQALRKVKLTPAQRWDNGKDGYIGCSIRFCLFDTISDVVWHILDVAPGSPAMEAGLCAHADYVIGTPLGIMRGERDLYDLVEDYIADELALHVYNSNTNEVREVIIIPREDWGGQGLLGCDVGFGYLHRLPKQNPLHQKTSSAGDVKEKADSTHTHTEKPAQQGESVLQEKKHLASEEEEEEEEVVAKESINEKSAYQHDGNDTDTQESDSHETTAPTPQPAQLEATVSTTNDQPASELATNDDDDNDEEVTMVTVTERSIPEQANAGTVATAPAEPAQSDEAEIMATDAKEEEEESRRSVSAASSLIQKEESVEEPKMSDRRITSEQPVESETIPDLARIDSTETPASASAPAPAPAPEPAPSQQKQQHHYRPEAIAARMKPGIHGRGSFSAGIGGGRGRMGHDGFPRNGGISLQDVQAQAQQGSSEYRAQKEKNEKKNERKEKKNERKEKKERKQEDEGARMSTSNESLNVQVLDNEDDSDNDDHDGREGVSHEKGRRSKVERRTKEERDADFHEIVVEGMIRNMSLGSSIFPL
ncbi:Golgi reassembly-stacking protein 2 [Mortierella sp. AD032]|nr:Golgi reassembly-stacking protein 2 [Mortierella sp. AD032]